MDVQQPDLFLNLVDPEELERLRDQVAILVGEMAKGLSRDRIADEMTALGCSTSTAMINAWSSPARTGHNIPLYASPIYESACRSTILSDWHVGVHHGVAFYGEEALQHEVAAELAALEYERAEFTKKIRLLRKQLGDG